MSVVDVPDTSDLQIASQCQTIDITRAGCIKDQSYMFVNMIDAVVKWWSYSTPQQRCTLLQKVACWHLGRSRVVVQRQDDFDLFGARTNVLVGFHMMLLHVRTQLA